MTNTFLTPSVIAREAAMLLSNSLIAGTLVYRDHQREFTDGYKKGDSISIRKPATFVANEFAGTSTPQAINEGNVSLVLEKHFDVAVEVTSKELSLSIQDFSKQVVEPMALAIATGVNAYVLSKYKEIPYFYDAGTSTPALPDTIAKLAQVPRVLNDNLVPVMPRNGIVSSSAQATLLGIEAFHSAEKRGDGGLALRSASMGSLLGIAWYMDQQVHTHTAGTFSTTGTPAINGAVAAGATTMAIDGGSGTETLKKGDLFTVADVVGQYVVTADATATAGAIAAVSFYPAAPAGGFPTDKAITVKKSHKANLVMHPNCIAMAAVPLALPMGGADGTYMSYNGVGIRMVMGYDMASKKNILAMDTLCGAKAIQPELGARVLEP